MIYQLCAVTQAMKMVAALHMMMYVTHESGQ